MTDLSKGLCNLAFQSLEKYVHYYNACNHQTWQGGDLQWEASTKSHTTLWLHGLKRSIHKPKASPLPQWFIKVNSGPSIGNI